MIIMAVHCPSQVDAFTDVPFGGNSAAVVLLPPGTELGDETRQQIAMEMNLSETAFLEPLTDAGEPCAASEGPIFRSASRYRLRWFTPTEEVALCGHATVASAAALIQGRSLMPNMLLLEIASEVWIVCAMSKQKQSSM